MDRQERQCFRYKRMCKTMSVLWDCGQRSELRIQRSVLFGDTWGNADFLYLLRNLLSLQQCPVTRLWKWLFLVVYFPHFIRFIFSLLLSLFSLDSSIFVRNGVTVQQLYWHDMAEFLFSLRTELLKPSVCQLFALQFRSSENVASHLKLKQQS